MKEQKENLDQLRQQFCLYVMDWKIERRFLSLDRLAFFSYDSEGNRQFECWEDRPRQWDKDIASLPEMIQAITKKGIYINVSFINEKVRVTLSSSNIELSASTHQNRLLLLLMRAAIKKARQDAGPSRELKK